MMSLRRSKEVLAKVARTARFRLEQIRKLSTPTKPDICVTPNNNDFAMKRSLGQPSPYTHPHLLRIDEVTPEFANFLRNLPGNNVNLCYDPDNFPVSSKKILDELASSSPSKIRYSGRKPREFVHKLRWIKSGAEVALMRKACAIGARGLAETMKFTRAGMDERSLVAKMDLECRIRGAEGLAYPPVIAGGERANIIHYLTADQRLQKEDLVLMDAGCEYFGYVSDITRTWPIQGKFTFDAQQCLYEALLEIHEQLLEYVQNVRPLVLSDLHKEMEILLGRQLHRLGLVKSNLEGRELLKVCDDVCPHHVSHYLGMDVHDTSSVSRTIDVKPGVCITVEPGVYISSGNQSMPKEFRGIGIRIEDDVLITETGAEILTKDCPRSLKDIERLCDSL